MTSTIEPSTNLEEELNIQDIKGHDLDQEYLDTT